MTYVIVATVAFVVGVLVGYVGKGIIGKLVNKGEQAADGIGTK